MLCCVIVNLEHLKKKKNFFSLTPDIEKSVREFGENWLLRQRFLREKWIFFRLQKLLYEWNDTTQVFVSQKYPFLLTRGADFLIIPSARTAVRNIDAISSFFFCEIWMTFWFKFLGAHFFWQFRKLKEVRNPVNITEWRKW